MYSIMYQYPGVDAEEVDTAESESEANILLGEYRLAYGSVGRLWIQSTVEE